MQHVDMCFVCNMPAILIATNCAMLTARVVITNLELCNIYIFISYFLRYNSEITKLV